MTDSALVPVEILTGSISWNDLHSAEVTLWQGDGEKSSVLLTPEVQARTWPGRVSGEPYSYQVRAADFQGQVIEEPVRQADSSQLVIWSPFAGHLEGVVVLVGRPEDSAASGFAEIRYEDPERDYRVHLTLDKLRYGEMRRWHFPILDARARTYSYRIVLSGGPFQRPSEWVEADHSIVAVPASPVRKVEVVTLIPFDQFVLARIALVYSGAEGEQTKEFLVRPSDDPVQIHSWEFWPDSTESTSYRYQATIYDAEGRSFEHPEQETDDGAIVITKPGGDG